MLFEFVESCVVGVFGVWVSATSSSSVCWSWMVAGSVSVGFAYMLGDLAFARFIL